MKKIHFSIALIICAIVVSSCKDDAGLTSALDAEKAGVFRAPGGKYSDYIISPEEAMDMVANDLKKSGGEFAKKRITGAEPVILGKITVNMKGWEDLYEQGYFKSEDPAFYIVHFETDGGFAIVFPDKDLGVSVLHAQTFESTSAEEGYKAAASYTPTPPVIDPDDPWWLEGSINPSGGKKLKDWVLDAVLNNIHSLGIEAINYPDPYTFRENPNGNNGGSYTDPTWSSLQTNTCPADFWVTSGYPLNAHQQGYDLGMIAPVVTEFLGFFGGEKTYFGQAGNWTAIIPTLKSGQVDDVAAYWAYKFSDYCRVHDAGLDYFKYVPLLLKNECGFGTVAPKTYIYDRWQYENTELSQLIKNGKPVIVYTNVPALAYKEEILYKNSYHQGHGGSVVFTYYDSKIWYKISLENTVETAWTQMSALEGAFYYIAY